MLTSGKKYWGIFMQDATKTVEPRTIRSSRIKSFFYLFGGIALVWVMTHAVRDSASQSGVIAVKLLVAGWVGIVLFGLAALGGAITLIHPRALTLDGSGFTLRTLFVRSQLKIAWRDIQGFHVRKQGKYKSIGFRLEPSAKTSLNRRPGIELSLSGAGWPLSTEKMVEVLNTYRQQALNIEIGPANATSAPSSANFPMGENLSSTRPSGMALGKATGHAIISFRQAIILGALVAFAVWCLQYVLAPWPNPIAVLGVDASIGAIVSAITYRLVFGWRKQ